jgi:hypothetical protein
MTAAITAENSGVERSLMFDLSLQRVRWPHGRVRWLARGGASRLVASSNAGLTAAFATMTGVLAQSSSCRQALRNSQPSMTA